MSLDDIQVPYRDKIPRWSAFALNAHEQGPVLSIYIHQSLWKESRRLIQTLQHAPSLPDLGDFFAYQDKFGYQGCGWVSIQPRQFDLNVMVSFPIPVVGTCVEGTVCTHCRGTGKDSFVWRVGESCDYCYGTGNQYRQDWQPVSAVVQSLSVLLEVLQFAPDTLIEHETLQLLAPVIGIVNRPLLGASFTGCFVTPLARQKMSLSWRSACTSTQQIVSVNLAIQHMERVYQIMFPMDRVQDDGEFSRFDCHIEQGGALYLQCSGDVGDMGPADYHWVDDVHGPGYELTCHNVSSPAYALTLLAGLIGVHEYLDLEV